MNLIFSYDFIRDETVASFFMIVLAELKMMQEKIRLLEARLCQNTQVSGPPPSASPTVRTSFINEAVAESKTASKVAMPSLQTNRDGCVSKPGMSSVNAQSLLQSLD